MLSVTLQADADTFIRPSVSAGSAAVLDVLDSNGPGDRIAYVRFDLSGVDLSQATSASLQLYKTAGTRSDTIVTDRFDVYGLQDVAGGTPQDWSEASLAEGNVGAEYTNTAGDGLDTTLLWNLDQESGANVFESVLNVNNSAQSVSGPDLLAFLESRAASNGLATFVTYVDAGNVRGWGYHSREATDEQLRPVLVLEGIDGGSPMEDPYPETPVVLPRQMEKLDRGIVAMRRSTTEIYVGWRLLGDDPAEVAFNLYRSADGGRAVKVNAGPLTQTTDFVDTSASVSRANAYFVRPVIAGIEQGPSESFLLSAFAPIQQYLEVPLATPSNFTFDNDSWRYTANDASVGDLDGDGDYEIVLKWIAEPTNPIPEKNYLYSPSPSMLVDAYDMDGTLLWRIDAGTNIKTIASSMQFVVYDFDGDGRSEVAMNTADGTTSYTVSGSVGAFSLTQNEVIGDPAANWTNPDGWVTSGPEYLTLFDGLTGDVLVTTDLLPDRGAVTDWGDGYGHRATTHKYVVAYLDGQRPSLVTGRGIYHGQAAIGRSKTELVAWNWRDGQLTEQWTFTATEGTSSDVNAEYVGQGNQAVSVADIDGDGFDEVIWGAMVVDHDGAGHHSTGRGHGDALHVADMDPDNPGLEVFEPHENPGEYGSAGGDYRDAMTGQLLIGIPATNDVGRGVALDIDPNYPGYEFWAATNDPQGGPRQIYNVQQGAIYDMPANMHNNFGVWWDADPLRETLDGTTIAKWRYDWATPGRQNIIWFAGSGIDNNAGLASNNGTKANPALSADILGDWREEVIWRKSDNSALQIWTTTINSTMRLPTLMHDLQYREAIAWQNVYYNQPPHPSYFIGAGMGEAPRPPIFFGGELAGDYNRDGAVDAADYTVWRNALGSDTDLSSDGDRSGVVDQADYLVWRENYGATAQPRRASSVRTMRLDSSPTANASLVLQQAAFASLSDDLETEEQAPLERQVSHTSQTSDLLLYAPTHVMPLTQEGDDTVTGFEGESPTEALSVWRSHLTLEDADTDSFWRAL